VPGSLGEALSLPAVFHTSPDAGILTSMSDSSLPHLAVVCRACGYPSTASVAGKITVEDEEEGGLFELSLIQCEHCESPSLVRQDEIGEATPVEVWPTSPRTLHEAIPQTSGKA
jgi:hypothetical protein